MNKNKKGEGILVNASNVSRIFRDIKKELQTQQVAETEYFPMIYFSGEYYGFRLFKKVQVKCGC